METEDKLRVDLHKAKLEKMKALDDHMQRISLSTAELKVSFLPSGYGYRSIALTVSARLAVFSPNLPHHDKAVFILAAISVLVAGKVRKRG